MNRRCPESPIIPVHVAHIPQRFRVSSGRGIAAGELTGAVGFALSAATKGTGSQRAGRGMAAQGRKRQKRENGQP